MTHSFGWKVQLPDQRDYMFELEKVSTLPLQVDLRSQCPPVYDQGALGSCTANAIAGALEFDMMKQGESPFTPSRLFIYYNERVLENSVVSDSGASVRDSAKAIATWGAPPEGEWPYDITRFAHKPAAKAYADGIAHTAILYRSVRRGVTMKVCLASGLPFAAGIGVYDSFESDSVAKTGVVPMPGKGESLLGGHAILIVGYDTPGKRFLFRNSWGESWGMAGYGWLPEAYLAKVSLSSDFWVVQSVR